PCSDLPLASITRHPILRNLHSFPTRRSSDLARTSTTRRCGSCGTSAGARARPFGPVGATETARVRRIDHRELPVDPAPARHDWEDRKSTRLNSSHVSISYAVFCLKKKITH